MSSLFIKRVSVIVEDMGRKREVNMRLENAASKKSLLNRTGNSQIQQYVPPPPRPETSLPPPAFSTENAIVVGLMVVDQVLGVMTKEIQENLEATCKGVEERLLREISMLEEKMNRVENAYENVNADQRLAGIENALVRARQSGVWVNYEASEPTVAYGDDHLNNSGAFTNNHVVAPVVGV